MNKYSVINEESNTKDIRCPNNHKVAEAQGQYVVIKCRCKHLVKVDMNKIKNKSKQ